MSKQDRQWLEAALKQYTFNDADLLQEICKDLKNQHSDEKLVNMLEELCELVELHPRNNLNLCLSGGMASTLTLICSNPNGKIKKLACQVFTAANSNNQEV